MKFFVSWTKREPLFQEYDPECNILVSPSNVPLNWSVSHWKTQPRELFVDSGAFSVRNNQMRSCQEILQRQLDITKKWSQNRTLYFSHPDILIPIKCNFYKQNKITKMSMERARLYFELHSKKNTCSIPIGVIQGFDEETIVNSYYELINIGYTHFALGSIGIRLSRYKKLCVNAINIAQKYNIKPLHLFGITLPINGSNFSNGIDSFDSSTPAKLAFYGTVLYGSPIERYVISPNSKQTYRDRCFTFRKNLSNPMPCDCPVCKVDPNKLIAKNDPEAKINRIIHNYFQIKWATEKLNSHGHGHLFH